MLTHLRTFDFVTDQPAESDRLNAYGQFLLHYRFPRTEVSLSYSHRNTNGSGFSLGATSDIARITATRSVGRRWEILGDGGYTHNDTLIPSTVAGVTANRYDFYFVGAAVHRRLGRYLTAFLNYRFSDLLFDSAACQGSGPCNSQRQSAMLGLTWHPRPIRLD